MKHTDNKKVLVVDDDSLISTLVAKNLESEGYEVDTASDGKEALKLASNTDNYSLIISDVMMPNMDGLEFFESFKKLKKDIPVILMSGHTSFDFALKALNLGALAFLVKPFENEELLKWVRKVYSAQILQRDSQARRDLFLRLDSEKHEMVIKTGLLMRGENFSHFSHRISERFCLSQRMDRMTVLKCSLAFQEALLNSVEHGNLGLCSSLRSDDLIDNGSTDPYDKLMAARLNDPRYADRKILVKYLRTLEEVKVTIIDEGKGFNVKSTEKIDENSLLPSGRGLILIRSTVDDVKFNETGNEITLTNYFSRESTGGSK